MKRTYKNIVPSFVALGLLIVVTPASAHHSFSMFDKTKETTINGTVSLFQWSNPHTYIWVYVPNDKGTQDLWAIEGAGPGGLSHNGWDKHTINPGDKVTLVLNPLKDGRTGGSFVSLTRMSDGAKFTEGGAAAAGG